MRRAADPPEIELLLLDGDNLLHEVRGSRDDAGVAWLLPNLSRWRPAGLRIVVALDGHPAPGQSSRPRVMRGIEVRHTGSRSADDVLIDLLGAQPYGGRARTAVVTRDRALAERVRRAGGLPRSVAWLTGQLSSATTGRRPAPSGHPVGIGQGSLRRVDPGGATGPEGEGREPWQPGRGATRKSGNPRRGAKASRRR